MNLSTHTPRSFPPAFLILLMVVTSSLQTGRGAEITQHFSEGNSDISVDAYPGSEGKGWTGPWRITSAGSGSGHGVEAEVVEDQPLDGGGAYLRFTAIRQQHAQSTHQAIVRDFNVSSVTPGAAGAFRIRLKLRLDGMEGGTLHVQGGRESNAAGGGTPWSVIFQPAQGVIGVLSMEEGTPRFIEIPAGEDRGWDLMDKERIYSLEVEIPYPGQLRYHLTLSDDQGNRWSTYTDNRGDPLVGRGGGYAQQQQLLVGANLSGDGRVQASIDAIRISVSRQRLRDWNVRVIKIDEN